MFCGLLFCFLKIYLSGKMELQVMEVLTDQRKGLGRNALEHPSLGNLQNKTQNGVYEQNLILSVKTVQTTIFQHLEKLT